MFRVWGFGVTVQGLGFRVICFFLELRGLASKALGGYKNELVSGFRVR